jgi:hypothetical protein
MQLHYWRIDQLGIRDLSFRDNDSGPILNPGLCQSNESRTATHRVFAHPRITYFLALFSCVLVVTGAQSLAQSVAGKPQVYRSAHHDISLPLRSMKPSPVNSLLKEEEGKEPERQEQGLEEEIDPGNQPSVARLPRRSAKQFDGVLQPSKGRRQQLTPGLNFDGISSNGWPAPDTNGVVGATQYVQYVNNRFAIYDKSSGNLLNGPVRENMLWSGFSGLCGSDNSGDIIAEYDKAAGRWVMSHHAMQKGGPNFQCVAVSTTSDATGSYYRYAFQLPTDDDPDYPKLSVWPDAYYLSINQLNPNNGSFIDAAVCALDRNSMLNGAAATSVCFQLSSSKYSSLLPADLDGTTPPAAGSPDYFLNLDTNNQSLDLWQFHVNFAIPSSSTFTGPVNIPVAAFNPACGGGTFAVCIPQAGTTQSIDSLGDRLMWRLAYRNFGDHDTLVATHSVATGSGNVGVRWYEIRNPGGNPTVYQQGTFAPDSNFRWMGSLAMDQLGDLAVGYSESSSSMDPAIYYTGRLATDPLGSLENESLIIAGAGVEQGTYRWGDYSGMSVDPVDDCTFWYTNEYYPVTGKSWHTRIASFKFPTCPGVTISPDNLPFPSQLVGTTSPAQAVTLSNKQSTTVNIGNIGFTGPASGDFAQTNNCGTSLPAAADCTIQVTFTPSATGTRSAALNVTDDANNNPQVSNVSGVGVVTAVTLSPSRLTFAAQAVGTASAPLSELVSNSSALPVTISGVSASGNYAETDNCTGNTLQPSQTCNVSVVFAPALTGSIPGTITVTDNANGSPQVLGLSGSGVKPLAVSPANMAFGTIAVGSSSPPQTATLTNNDTSPVTVSFSASGEYSAKGSGKNPCPATLAPNAKCTIAVIFSPTTNGSTNGSLAVSYGAALSPQMVSLTGTGSGGSTGPLSFSPSSVGFGKIAVGRTSANETVTVTNNGSTSVNISSVLAEGNFSLITRKVSPCGGPLAPGISCKFSVNFSPTIIGLVKSGVTVTDNANISPQVLNLSGTGMLPIAISPSTLAFAAQSVGTTSPPQIVTVTSNQNSSLSLGIAASGDYVIQSGGSNPCGTSLPALGQCTVGVAFSPSATGPIPGAVSFTYSGAFSPQEVALSGTGR